MVFQIDGRRGFWYAISGTWVFIPDKARAGDNLGNHAATQPLGWTTNDADKLLFTQGGGANGSKISHETNWQLSYYAGPNSGTAGTHRFLTGTPTGWTERMRITSTGNVGISTTNPRGKFDVDGPGDTYLVDNANSGSGQSVFLPGHLYLAPFSGTSGLTYVQARVPNATSATNIGLQFRTTDAGSLRDALLISAAGNVGIGTSSPTQRLTVAGGASITGNTVIVGNATVNGQAVLGLVHLSQDYSINGNTWSGYSIVCPSGTRLIGGGGGHRDNNSAQTSIRVNYSGPRNSNPDTVWQLNVENTSNNSRAIRIYCICARIQ